jgi:NIMA-interacting peptidyl-prolyl cis-trans isomerase 1
MKQPGSEATDDLLEKAIEEPNGTMVAETATIADAAVQAVADALQHQQQEQQQQEQEQQQQQDTPDTISPPESLPTGWILKESRAQPNQYYYHHMDTGVSSWQPPAANAVSAEAAPDKVLPSDSATAASVLERQTSASLSAAASNDSAEDETKKGGGTKKRSAATPAGDDARRTDAAHNTNVSSKRLKTSSTPSSSSLSSTPSKVRVLHILKKHKDSRRPSSWRQPVITDSRDEAAQHVTDIVDILAGETGDDLRATFEELARTESDCSSAKRGGDLGFFGRKKMQPAFEEASFALQIGQLSPITDTSSGVHVILRIG